MSYQDLRPQLGDALFRALSDRGFTELTPVQRAAVTADARTHDLRLSSQTGSGKTVAVGLAIRHLIDAPMEKGPLALILTPTRELAKQVERELGWLYGYTDRKAASLIGGASYRAEQRALADKPAIVVATPGRLLDHLERGSLDPAEVESVVLDEADRMLDMGFRDELVAITDKLPGGQRTHLVSATFPPELSRLAAKVQTNPLSIEGTPLGQANTDIDHVIHPVAPSERVGAIQNLLLSSLSAPTLIFVKTRADVGELTETLSNKGFRVLGLSGDLEQRERNRALAAFRRGDLNALVATDVAARGIDVQDVGRVIHAEVPTDADSYTHRSGRTGRAGRKGTSSIVATTSGFARTCRFLDQMRLPYRIEAVPDADTIEAAIEQRLVADITAPVAGPKSEESQASEEPQAREEPEAGEPQAGEEPEAVEEPGAEAAEPPSDALAAPETEPRAEAPPTTPPGPAPSERALALATRLLSEENGTVAIARLIDRARRTIAARPVRLTPVDLERPKKRGAKGPGAPRRDGGVDRDPDNWVPFRVSFGRSHGADTRRLLAMLCRRGGIQGKHVGSIQVLQAHSIVGIAADVAHDFAERTAEPDPRDPRIRIRRQAPHGGARQRTDGHRPEGDRRPPFSKRPSPNKRPRAEDRSAGDERPMRPKRPTSDERPVARPKRPKADERPHPERRATSDERPPKRSPADRRPPAERRNGSPDRRPSHPSKPAGPAGPRKKPRPARGDRPR